MRARDPKWRCCARRHVFYGGRGGEREGVNICMTGRKMVCVCSCFLANIRDLLEERSNHGGVLSKLKYDFPGAGGRDVEKCMNNTKSLRKVATFSCRNTIRTEEDNCFKLAAAQPATGNYIDVASDNRPPTQTAFFYRLSILRSSQKKEEFSITVENQISTRLHELATSCPDTAINLWLSSALALICKPPQILWSCGLTLTGVRSHSIVSIADDDEDDRRPLPLVIVLATGDGDAAVAAVAARRPQWWKFFLFNSGRSGHPSFLRGLRVSDRSRVKILPRIRQRQPASRSGGPSASFHGRTTNLKSSMCTRCERGKISGRSNLR